MPEGLAEEAKAEGAIGVEPLFHSKITGDKMFYPEESVTGASNSLFYHQISSSSECKNLRRNEDLYGEKRQIELSSIFVLCL